MELFNANDIPNEVWSGRPEDADRDGSDRDLINTQDVPDEVGAEGPRTQTATALTWTGSSG